MVQQACTTSAEKKQPTLTMALRDHPLSVPESLKLSIGWWDVATIPTVVNLVTHAEFQRSVNHRLLILLHQRRKEKPVYPALFA
jgi:hypothetical protein